MLKWELEESQQDRFRGPQAFMCLKKFFCLDSILWPISAIHFLKGVEWNNFLHSGVLFFFYCQYFFTTATPTASVITRTRRQFFFSSSSAHFLNSRTLPIVLCFDSEIFSAIWRKNGKRGTLGYKIPCSILVRKIPQHALQQNNFLQQHHFPQTSDYL